MQRKMKRKFYVAFLIGTYFGFLGYFQIRLVDNTCHPRGRRPKDLFMECVYMKDVSLTLNMTRGWVRLYTMVIAWYCKA